MKCNELMIWDWCCNGHGLPMQIIDVGEEAYEVAKANYKTFCTTVKIEWEE